MKSVCRTHGVEDEETEAYMLEYLFNQMMNMTDDYEEKKKKEIIVACKEQG